MEDKNLMDLEDVYLNTLVETGAEVRLITSFLSGTINSTNLLSSGRASWMRLTLS